MSGQTQDVLGLIGAQKAEFNHASALRTWVLRTQTAIAALAALTIPVKSDVVLYVVAIIALGLALVWLYLWNELGESRSHAERLRRTTMLVGGLGVTLSGADLLELSREGKASQSEAKRLIDPDYFASKKAPGVPRLVDMLEESAIWTTNLAKIAARETWLLFGGFTVVMLLVLLSAAVVAEPSEWQLGARIIMAMLASLLSADFLGAAISYGGAAQAARRTVDRLQMHKGANPALEPVMLIFGDYNSAVESMPPFSSGLYPRHEKRLNEEYKMFLTGPQ
ncbi:MAG: hypothetical protein DI570_11045 [Phenylobacterium zucineum]|nr:MAG: hypothetical protein DI570_11045 [Phenylobacterium zucineum]